MVFTKPCPLSNRQGIIRVRSMDSLVHGCEVTKQLHSIPMTFLRVKLGSENVVLVNRRSEYNAIRCRGEGMAAVTALDVVRMYEIELGVLQSFEEMLVVLRGKQVPSQARYFKRAVRVVKTESFDDAVYPSETRQAAFFAGFHENLHPKTDAQYGDLFFQRFLI